jgi:hypothetical protein
MPSRGGDGTSMEPPSFSRCSILLTFKKLMSRTSGKRQADSGAEVDFST